MNESNERTIATPSDAAVAQAFRERITINESPFVYHAVIDRAREIEALRERELDAGAGFNGMTDGGSLTYAGQRKVVEHMTTELAAAIAARDSAETKLTAVGAWCEGRLTHPNINYNPELRSVAAHIKSLIADANTAGVIAAGRQLDGAQTAHDAHGTPALRTQQKEED